MRNEFYPFPLRSLRENFPRGQALSLSQISGHALNINSIRNVFPKDTAEWLHWIEQGKLLYTYKEKVQAAIDQQRINLADVDYLNLDKIETILDSFTNPQVSDIVSQSAPTVNGRTARGVTLSILLSLMSRL